MTVMSLRKTFGQKQAIAPAAEVLEIELAPHAVHRLAGDHRGLRIKCTAAALWITQDGDPEDHILAASEQFTVTQPGPVVLQGMSR